jgi:hypothetical protein
LTLDPKELFSSTPLPRSEIHKGRMLGGNNPARTLRALGVFAVIKIRLLVARRWQIRLAIVWDFPVPGHQLHFEVFQ